MSERRQFNACYPLFQVLAPTNEAFGKLDSHTMSYLQTSEGQEALMDVLANHIVQEVVPSHLLTSTVTTMHGSALIVQHKGQEEIIISGATVLELDMLASNGILHMIDNVLLPSTFVTVTGLLQSSDVPLETERGQNDTKKTLSMIEPAAESTSEMETIDVTVTKNAAQQMRLRRRVIVVS